MEFSSEYWYSFHYSDSEGYLIFCCHSVASTLKLIPAASFNSVRFIFLSIKSFLSLSWETGIAILRFQNHIVYIIAENTQVGKIIPQEREIWVDHHEIPISLKITH